MSGSISFNPYGTTAPANSFLLESQGLVQGMAYDDPSARMWLAGGTLATTETITMWGGVPIEEMVNIMGSGSEGLGPALKRATSQGTVTGWSVFNQAASMVIVPGNSVPLAGTGNYVSFYRNATNQRIAVQCDPAIVSALVSADEPITPTTALYWDVTYYRITTTTTGGNWALPTSVRLLSVNTNSKIVNYASGTVTWTTGDAAIILI